MTTPALLRVPDLAVRLNVSRSHAYRLVDAGAIATVRIGKSVRVTEQALAEFIAARSTPARPAMQRRLQVARSNP